MCPSLQDLIQKKLMIFPVLVLIIALVPFFQVRSDAATTLTEGVSILNPKQNIHGVGYEWDNIHDTLTLTNLNIDTDDDYGLKVPDGATVILKGVNRISAARAALYIGGTVTVKGSGRLILDGGEYGVFCNSSDKRSKLSIIEGSFDITAGTSGFYSAVERISVSGKAVINVTGGKASFDAVNVDFSNGASVTASGQIKVSTEFLISASDVSVTSDGPAVSCPKVRIERVTAGGYSGQIDGDATKELISAPVLKTLTSLRKLTRRFIMQKARRHRLYLLRPLVSEQFQGLFHSSTRSAFHLSLTVLVHYRSLGSI